jgi:hypothetical protein
MTSELPPGRYGCRLVAAVIAAACLAACSSVPGNANKGSPAGGSTGEAGGAAGLAGGAPGGTTGSATIGGCRYLPDGGDPNDGGPYCSTCQSWAPPGNLDGGTAPAGPNGGALTNGKLGCIVETCATKAAQPTDAGDNTLGFTAADLLDAIVGPGLADLTWFDGTSTTLRLSAHYMNLSVEVARPDTVPVVSDAGTSTFAACGELTAGQAIVTLSTDDGRLAGEEFTAQMVGNTQPNQPTTVVPVFNWNGADQATVHGSLTLPDNWGAVAGTAQIVLVGIVPKSSSCSPDCLPNPTAADTAWSATESACGYDGKLVTRFAVKAPPPACPEAYTTVATWRWR